MDEIYVNNVPDSCYKCRFDNEEIIYGNSCMLYCTKDKDCPLRSIQKHDEEVKDLTIKEIIKNFEGKSKEEIIDYLKEIKENIQHD